MLVFAVACNELFSGEGTGIANQIFQVGGRERLAAAARQYIAWPRVVPDLAAVQAAFRPVPRGDSVLKLIMDLKQSVFIRNGVETAAMLGVLCLIRQKRSLRTLWKKLYKALQADDEDVLASIVGAQPRTSTSQAVRPWA